MPLLSRTLQKKILVILLIVSIMPAVLGILQTYWGSLIALDGTIGAYMEERAQVMARGVEENLRERLATLSLAGRDERLIRFLSTPSPIIGQPDESAGMLRNIFQDTILSGRDVFVYDMEGECLAASRPDPPVILDAPWLPQAASLGPGDTFAAFVSGPNRQEPRVLFISPMTLPDSPDTRFFLVHDLAMNDILKIPVFTGESERWTIGLHVSPANLIFGINHPEKVAPVLEPRLGTLRNRFSGWFATQEIGREKHIIAFAGVHFIRLLHREGKSNSDWTLFLSFDISDVVVLIHLILWRMSLFGLIMIVGLVLLAIYLSRKIVYPIRKLQAGIHDIASGRLDSRVEILTGDEIQDLAEGFNEMARRLNETYADLRRSMKEINEQTGQISLLYDIAQAINAALDLDLIFADLAQQMKKIVEFDFLGVCLAPEGESNFTSIVLFPEDAHEDSEPASILLSRSRFENVMESRIPVVIQDLMYEGLTNQDARLQASGIRSCLLLHLHSASGVIGMLVLAHNQAGTYGEREIRLVSRICEAVAIAVEHSRLYSRIRRFAQELEEKVAQRTLQLQETHTNMVRTEKLAASGKLAASLAHEINNPLGIIKNYLKIFTDQWHAHAARLESAGLSLEPLEIVREELDRIARIVRGLLDLYGPAEARRMMTDINAEAMRLVQLMRQSLEKKGVAVHVALGKDLPRSFLTPDHVTQILLNILTNAEDATPSGGSISIATSFIPPAGPVSGDDRGFIEVVVKDTGCGIPPEIMGSIFDPFFTTKKKGAATGLGLFVIHGLLEGMGGKIIINSDPGRGTNIRILFPLIPEIPPATT